MTLLRMLFHCRRCAATWVDDPITRCPVCLSRNFQGIRTVAVADAGDGGGAPRRRLPAAAPAAPPVASKWSTS